MTFLSSRLVQRSQWKGSKAERMVRPMRCRWLQQGRGKEAKNRRKSGTVGRGTCGSREAAASNESSQSALCAAASFSLPHLTLKTLTGALSVTVPAPSAASMMMGAALLPHLFSQ